jgi:hypothetical protein
LNRSGRRSACHEKTDRPSEEKPRPDHEDERRPRGRSVCRREPEPGSRRGTLHPRSNHSARSLWLPRECADRLATFQVVLAHACRTGSASVATASDSPSNLPFERMVRAVLQESELRTPTRKDHSKCGS